MTLFTKQHLLKVFGAALLMSNLLLVPVKGQEETESSEIESSEAVENMPEDEPSSNCESTTETIERITAIGDSNPFTEDELREQIQPNDAYDPELFYEVDDILMIFTEVHQMMLEAQANEEVVTMEQITSAFGEPSHVTTAGQSEFHHYVASEDLVLLEISIQYYGEDFELSNAELTQTIPSSYEAINVSEEDIVAALENPENQTSLVDLLGPAYNVRYVFLPAGVVENISWVDLGHVFRDEVTTDINRVTLAFDPSSQTVEYEVGYIDGPEASDNEADEAVEMEETEETSEAEETSEEPE